MKKFLLTICFLIGILLFYIVKNHCDCKVVEGQTGPARRTRDREQRNQPYAGRGGSQSTPTPTPPAPYGYEQARRAADLVQMAGGEAQPDPFGEDEAFALIEQYRQQRWRAVADLNAQMGAGLGGAYDADRTYRQELEDAGTVFVTEECSANPNAQAFVGRRPGNFAVTPAGQAVLQEAGMNTVVFNPLYARSPSSPAVAGGGPSQTGEGPPIQPGAIFTTEETPPPTQGGFISGALSRRSQPHTGNTCNPVSAEVTNPADAQSKESSLEDDREWIEAGSIGCGQLDPFIYYEWPPQLVRSHDPETGMEQEEWTYPDVDEPVENLRTNPMPTAHDDGRPLEMVIQAIDLQQVPGIARYMEDGRNLPFDILEMDQRIQMTLPLNFLRQYRRALTDHFQYEPDAEGNPNPEVGERAYELFLQWYYTTCGENGENIIPEGPAPNFNFQMRAAFTDREWRASARRTQRQVRNLRPPRHYLPQNIYQFYLLDPFQVQALVELIQFWEELGRPNVNPGMLPNTDGRLLFRRYQGPDDDSGGGPAGGAQAGGAQRTAAGGRSCPGFGGGGKI